MDDIEAITLLKQGDIGGLEVLVQKYQLHAIRAADLILHDRQQSEDVVQSAFLRAYQRIHQFDDHKPFGPWFMRSVVNDAVRMASKNKRNISLDGWKESELFSRFDRLVLHEARPEAVVESREIRQAILDAISLLSPDQRAVIVLHYFLDLDLHEVSAQTGSPEGTIKWRLHSARKYLKSLLKPIRNDL